MLGWVQLWRGQGEASVAAGWQAVALDPNNADAHLFLAFSLAAMGRGEEALYYIEKGIRLNPHPSAVYMLVLGLSHFVLENYEEALAAFKRGTELTPVFIPTQYWLCLSYSLLGRDQEARSVRDALLALASGRTPLIRSPGGFWFTEELRQRTAHLAELAGLWAP
jgi:tetratricopeptide (TPR) repeat protein